MTSSPTPRACQHGRHHAGQESDEAGLTQEQVAERSGAGVRTIRRLESGGSTNRRTGKVYLLADAVGLGAGDRRHLAATIAVPRGGPAFGAAVSEPEPQPGHVPDPYPGPPPPPCPVTAWRGPSATAPPRRAAPRAARRLRTGRRPAPQGRPADRPGTIGRAVPGADAL
ncbi:helix-turn-helix domain-containing protein [Streptomyces sp. NPDC059092]|uniref:helix-turn-helix domain-containing protein n=1 Tax=Streptomyces sp. NPDC059092 TaxID=3346725 RepID=UPI0036C62599